MGLFSLARGKEIPMHRVHDALNGASITAQVFQRQLAALPAHGVRTLWDLIKIGKP